MILDTESKLSIKCLFLIPHILFSDENHTPKISYLNINGDGVYLMTPTVLDSKFTS